MSSGPDLNIGEDQVCRCWWCGSDPIYVQYHDQEWGIPVDQDQRLFEKICLEGFQSGLSWITILKKRDAFREAFAHFDFEKVARFRPPRVDRLVQNAAIVRHRGKIESTINNAKRAKAIVKEFGSLATYFWQFEPPSAAVLDCREQIPSQTEQSLALSKDLKRRGWSFVGPTTCYAFMQSMGMVNDHLQGCRSWVSVERARQRFQRPE